MDRLYVLTPSGHMFLKSPLKNIYGLSASRTWQENGLTIAYDYDAATITVNGTTQEKNWHLLRVYFNGSVPVDLSVKINVLGGKCVDSNGWNRYCQFMCNTMDGQYLQEQLRSQSNYYRFSEPTTVRYLSILTDYNNLVTFTDYKLQCVVRQGNYSADALPFAPYGTGEHLRIKVGA